MSDKIAFVTGASRGIGKATAIALAKTGYDVVIAARTVQEGQRFDYSPTLAGSAERSLPGSLELTAEEIRARGRRALPVRLDLLDRPSIDAALELSQREWGPVDLLVNNGIYQGPGLMDRFLDLPDEAIRRIFEGNVFAQIHLTQRVVGEMVRRGHGIVINLTSTAGRQDPPGPVGEGGWGYAYAASKAAFHRIAGLLHAELNRDGIRAYNLDPGYVVTEAMRAMFGDETDLDRHYRGLQPDVPAAAVAWLASDDPDAVALAGQTLHAASLCRERGLISSDRATAAPE